MDGLYRNILLAAAFLIWATGCQVAAPIQVWTPPQLRSTVGCKIAIAPIAGDQAIAGPLHTAMLVHAPRDPGRTLQCIDTRSLQDQQTIRLVSAVEGESSDIANLSLARRQGIDFLLTGEIISQPSKERMQLHRAKQASQMSAAHHSPAGPETLAVSWKLVDVRDRNAATGLPVVTQHVGALDAQSIATAAAEDAWKLITPYVRTESVNLAVPRLAPGSRRVRRGNVAALAGDWMTAQDSWTQVLAEHPEHDAALHNLSIAAVARQDFDAAREMIGAALNLSNKPLYKQTAVWIESREREYCKAFNLPGPETGWAATRR